MQRQKEATDKLSYLDMYIHIEGRRFFTSVFDKRDAFKFYIVNYPFLDSNIPTKPAYGVYISQLVRIGRICDKYADFKDTVYDRIDAAATINFSTQFGAATIRERRLFESGVYFVRRGYRLK